MMLAKQQVLDLIGQQGTPDQLSRAAQILPDQVDPTQFAGYAEQIGVDPQLLSGLESGLDPASVIDDVVGGELGQAEGLVSRVLSLLGR